MAERTGAGGLARKVWSDHRPLVLGVATTLVVALVAVGVLVARSDSDGDVLTPDESRRRLTEALNAGSVPPAGDQPSAGRPAAATAALTASVEEGNRRSYYARYDVTDGSSAAANALEVWRRPPLLRRMTTVRSGGSESRDQVFVLPSGVVSCAGTGNSGWTCQPRPDLRPGAADPFTLPEPGAR